MSEALKNRDETLRNNASKITSKSPFNSPPRIIKPKNAPPIPPTFHQKAPEIIQDKPTRNSTPKNFDNKYQSPY